MNPSSQKRYQVFVSSTFLDLQDERQEVIQALLELNCIPAGMELFPAADDDQWTLIKKVIDDCDYYVVILGGRYGSIGPAGISYTRMEYEYAVSSKKPVMAFLHGAPETLGPGKVEMEEDKKRKLDEFRETVKQKVCRFWRTAPELGGHVSRSLVRMIQEKPAVGWIRADSVPSEATLEEIVRLRRKVEELEGALAAARNEASGKNELLANGDETVVIHYYGGEVQLAWREIFRAIAPLVSGPFEEGMIHEGLRQYIFDKHRPVSSIAYLTLLPSDLQMIKLQLIALGIIERHENGTWRLTAAGERDFARMAAVPSARAGGSGVAKS